MNKIVKNLGIVLILPKKILVIFVTIIALVGIGTSGYLYSQYKKVQRAIDNPEAAGRVEAKDLVKKISRLMLLPDGEIPTVATVSDDKKLKDQPFFDNSSNGDKLLIYAKAKTVVLYRPKSNKIINVGPLTIEKQAQKANGTTEELLRLAIYNGTTDNGLTTQTEELLKSKLDNVSFSQKTQAKQSYPKTRVIAIAPNHEEKVTEIAKLLDGEVGLLPKNEISPNNTDILVIVGN